MQFLAFLCFLAIVLAGSGTYVYGLMLHLQYPKGNMQKDYSYRPSVSILLPCYQEGRAVYDTIKSIAGSDYEGPLEIIVTDDCSMDDSFKWVLKAQEEFKHIPINAGRNPKNLGKTQTILNALNRSVSEIVMIVDSDTLLDKSAIKEVVACFGCDPKMAIVGIPAGVRNPNQNALTGYQAAIYYSGFRLYRIPQCHYRTLGCVGGYAFAIKRSVFKEIEPDIIARRWFGCTVNDGEDRFMTHAVLLRGYHTYQDSDAKCWTRVPSTFKAYWGQQIRWRRTFLRDFFWTIRTLSEQVWKLHPLAIWQYIFYPLALFVAMLDVTVIVASDSWFSSWQAISYMATMFFLVVVMQRFHPEQKLTHPLKVLVYTPWWIINTMLVTIAALFTLDTGSWGNRG